MKPSSIASSSFATNTEQADLKETAIHCGFADSIDTDIVFINSSGKPRSNRQQNSGYSSTDSKIIRLMNHKTKTQLAQTQNKDSNKNKSNVLKSMKEFLHKKSCPKPFESMPIKICCSQDVPLREVSEYFEESDNFGTENISEEDHTPDWMNSNLMRTQNSESKIIKKSFNSPVYWSKEQLNYEVPKPQGNSASKINLKETSRFLQQKNCWQCQIFTLKTIINYQNNFGTLQNLTTELQKNKNFDYLNTGLNKNSRAFRTQNLCTNNANLQTFGHKRNQSVKSYTTRGKSSCIPCYTPPLAYSSTEKCMTKASNLNYKSPGDTVCNFDLSSIANQFSSRFAENSHMSNIEIKKNFECLLEQAKITEMKMRSLIETQKQPHISMNESIEEQYLITEDRANNRKYYTDPDEHLYQTQKLSKVDKSTNTVQKGGTKTKLLKKELKNCSLMLQNSIMISMNLLNEVHRLDNEVAKLQHDKERLSNKILNFQNSENDHTKYEKLMNENQILKQRLAEYEKGANNQDE